MQTFIYGPHFNEHALEREIMELFENYDRYSQEVKRCVASE